VHGTMGERLAWARNQQGLILQQVSERSGLAIGYISQLEKGAKVNPTIDALARLSKALNVSVAFVLGEVTAPLSEDGTVGMGGNHAWKIGHAFLRRMSLFTPREKERLMLSSLEERFATVVDFLCEAFPDLFTRPVIAFQLGLSVRGLNDILERNCDVSPMTLSQMVQITGIPQHFFATGKLDAPPEMKSISPADVIRFLGVVAQAVQSGIAPEEVSLLIREATGRR
jgi:transcriptional regulator with XRE-family HTH domain